jgi:hypothetical protein
VLRLVARKATGRRSPQNMTAFKQDFDQGPASPRFPTSVPTRRSAINAVIHHAGRPIRLKTSTLNGPASSRTRSIFIRNAYASFKRV